MKKFLLTTSLLAIISCSQTDQNVRFYLSLNEKQSNIGAGRELKFEVVDDRVEKEFIGNKEFCDGQKVNILNEQNLAKILKKEIDNQLMQRGFKKGESKIVELHIERLKYKTDCGWFIGKSEAEILLKLVVIDSKTGNKITKNFTLSNNGSHFMRSLASTDSSILNDLLQEVVENVLEDESLKY